MRHLRIKGIILQNIFQLRHALEDIIDIFYWPAVDVILWGLVTVFLRQLNSSVGGIVGFLLGGLILWDIIRRAQQDISFSFLRNAWNRNLINLFSTPLTSREFIIATMLLGLIKTILALSVIAAIAFFLYSFNVFSLGFWLLPFFASLIIFGWTMGILITGLIIRYGLRIQTFSWSLIVVLQPLSAVFYPVSVLPGFLQKIAWFLPTSHIFEGMRQVLSSGGLPREHLIWAFGLNIVYFIFAAGFFNFMFEKAREKGRLVKIET